MDAMDATAVLKGAITDAQERFKAANPLSDAAEEDAVFGDAVPVGADRGVGGDEQGLTAEIAQGDGQGIVAHAASSAIGLGLRFGLTGNKRSTLS